MKLTSCSCCGLIQYLPSFGEREEPVCVRCHSRLLSSSHDNRFTVAWALAALALYAPGILLPLLIIDELGHYSENSLLTGVITLYRDGYALIGTVVLLFSLVLPPLKLFILLILSQLAPSSRTRYRAQMYRVVEHLGKWSMLDVMLVAVLIAFVKVGDLISIKAGVGVIAFTLMVVFSLFASLSFDPRYLWEEGETGL